MSFVTFLSIKIGRIIWLLMIPVHEVFPYETFAGQLYGWHYLRTQFIENLTLDLKHLNSKCNMSILSTVFCEIVGKLGCSRWNILVTSTHIPVPIIIYIYIWRVSVKYFIAYKHRQNCRERNNVNNVINEMFFISCKTFCEKKTVNSFM